MRLVKKLNYIRNGMLRGTVAERKWELLQEAIDECDEVDLQQLIPHVIREAREDESSTFVVTEEWIETQGYWGTDDSKVWERYIRLEVPTVYAERKLAEEISANENTEETVDTKALMKWLKRQDF